jgi:hypothetical protein
MPPPSLPALESSMPTICAPLADRGATVSAPVKRSPTRRHATANGLPGGGKIALQCCARRGQRRGQKGPNRSAPALAGADSRVANGADTEIRTQDLLFTNGEVERVVLSVGTRFRGQPQ